MLPFMTAKRRVPLPVAARAVIDFLNRLIATAEVTQRATGDDFSKVVDRCQRFRRMAVLLRDDIDRGKVRTRKHFNRRMRNIKYTL